MIAPRGKILPEWKVLWMYPRARAGDPIAFEALRESVHYLVVMYAKRYSSQKRSIDFMVSEGMYGFCRGVANGRWNPGRGSWSTYITFYIRGQMQAAVGRESSLVHIPCQAEDKPCVMYIEELESYDAVDSHSEGRLDMDDRDAYLKVLEAMECLDYRSSEVLMMRTVGEMTLGEVGERFGVCKERVRQIQQAAVRKVRGVCRKQGR